MKKDVTIIFFLSPLLLLKEARSTLGDSQQKAQGSGRCCRLGWMESLATQEKMSEREKKSCCGVEWRDVGKKAQLAAKMVGTPRSL